MNDPKVRFRQLVEDYTAGVYGFDEYVARRTQLLNSVTARANTSEPNEIDAFLNDEDDTVRMNQDAESDTTAVQPPFAASSADNGATASSTGSGKSPDAVPATSTSGSVDSSGGSSKLLMLGAVVVLLAVAIGFLVLGPPEGDSQTGQLANAPVAVEVSAPVQAYVNAAKRFAGGSAWGESALFDLEDAWFGLNNEDQSAVLARAEHRIVVTAIKNRAIQIASLPEEIKSDLYDEILGIESVASNLGFGDELASMERLHAVSVTGDSSVVVAADEPSEPDVPEIVNLSDSNLSNADSSSGDSVATTAIVEDDIEELSEGDIKAAEEAEKIKQSALAKAAEEKAKAAARRKAEQEKAKALQKTKAAEAAALAVVTDAVPRPSDLESERPCSIDGIGPRAKKCLDMLADGSKGPDLAMLPVSSDSSILPIAVQVFETSVAEYLKYCVEAKLECAPQTEQHAAAEGDGTLPVTMVSWAEANAYAEWLSRQTATRYRLPTAEESRYFTAAGSTAKYYSGDTIDISGARYQKETPVSASETRGNYNRNNYSLFHTVGNVREWLAKSGDSHWVAGGDFSSDEKSLVTGFKEEVQANLADKRTGFRLVRPLQ